MTMSTIERGQRKITAFRWSVAGTVLIGLAYLVVCAYTKQQTDPVTMAAILGALGGSKWGFDWSNTRTHQAQAREQEKPESK